MEEEIISISELIDILKAKWRIILITTLLTVIVSVLYSFFLLTPMYSSSLKVFIGKNSIEKKEYSSGDVTLYQNFLKTYSELVKTDDLSEKAIKSSGLNVAPEKVISGLEVKQGEETQIMTISYKSSDIALSKNVLDAVTDEFIKEAKELIPNVNLKVVESSKYPINPYNSNSIRNIFLGVVIGVFIGVVYVFLLEYLNNTFKSKDQIEAKLGIFVIGLIPCEEK